MAASLAPARATAKLLACLPVFGLALGMSMGARPLDFLLGSGLGAVGAAPAAITAPNDPLFKYQFNLRAIGIPAAWEVTRRRPGC